MRKILFLLALPMLGQNYASYSTYPVARMSFLQHQFKPQRNSFLDPSLVGYWFEAENTGPSITDRSGNSFSGNWQGTASGTSGFYSAGKTGPFAASFNGSNNQIIFTSFTTYYSPYTLAAWIKPASTAIPQVIAANLHNGTAYGSEELTMGGYAENPGSSDALAICSYNTCAAASTATVTGSWQFVVGTFDGTNLNLYVNGSLVTTTASAAPSTNNQSLLEGSDFGPRYQYSGLVNNLRYYKRALSLAEIQAIYNAENH